MKLDAHALQLDILHSTLDPNDASQLLMAMVSVLQTLREHLPYENVSQTEVLDIVRTAAAAYNSKPNEDLADEYGRAPENFNVTMQVRHISFRSN